MIGKVKEQMESQRALKPVRVLYEGLHGVDIPGGGQAEQGGPRGDLGTQKLIPTKANKCEVSVENPTVSHHRVN